MLQFCPTLCDPMNCSLPVGFSRQVHWNGLPCPPPRDLPDPGIEPTSFMSPAPAGGFFTTSTTWEAQDVGVYTCPKGLNSLCPYICNESHICGRCMESRGPGSRPILRFSVIRSWNRCNSGCRHEHKFLKNGRCKMWLGFEPEGLHPGL